jgi:APA family basic amino acid/polyamine antiporter
MDADHTGESLKRVIGVPALAAAVVNNTIGAGIYVLPAIVSIQLGAAGILGYLFCGAMLVTIMLCYMEIGSKVTGSGGSYTYVETAFGPFAGFIINWLFFVGWGALSSAALMNVLAGSLGLLIPALSTPVMHVLLCFILLSIMVCLNVRSAKHTVKFLNYITVIKLLPLLGVIVLGIGQIKFNNLHWQSWPPVKTFGNTALILFFAFAGFETSLNVSGEIKNPKRTLPLGVTLGGAGVFIIYILLQIITQGVLGAHIGQFKDAPLAAVAENIVGPVGATLLLIAAVVSCLGTVSGDVLATPRLLFAGANDGLFPKYLGKVHPRFATPYLAVITYALLIFILSISGGFKQLAITASCVLLLIYLAVILSMIKLRSKREPGAQHTFKVPGGLLIPFMAIAAIIWCSPTLAGRR